MELRVLALRRKNTHRRGDRSNLWVSMRDPRTSLEDPLRLGENCFSDKFRVEFFEDNNDIVIVAVRIDADLGESYSKFFELGMRVSQQLDGRLRELTIEQYQKQLALLKERVIELALDKKRQTRDAQLDSFLVQLSTSSASEQDKIEMISLVTILRSKQVEKPKNSRDFADLTGRIMRDEYGELVMTFPQVPDSLKSSFFAVATYKMANGGIDWFDGELEDLLHFLDRSGGIENAKLYLDYLHTGLQRESQDHCFRSNYWVDTQVSVAVLNDAQKSLYFTSLRRAQLAGADGLISGCGAANAADLLAKKGPEEAARIIEQAFALLSESDGENKFLRCLQRSTN